MIARKKRTISRCKTIQGRGLVNSIINALPVGLHLPGYQYCGPGTKLRERLARGDPGINLLDKACKEHDIAYSKYKNINDRNIADKILEEKAWQRVKSRDAFLGERANAALITNIMKAKTKLGMGLKNKTKLGMTMKKKKKPAKKKQIRALFRKAVQNARKRINVEKPDNLKNAIKIGLKAAKEVIKGKKKDVDTPRIIPIPKVGGILPFMIPVFAALSAAGSITGGVSSIVKLVSEATNAKKQLAESQRHNEAMEAISIGKQQQQQGSGLFLKPYKKGMGLYLNPQSKNY